MQIGANVGVLVFLFMLAGCGARDVSENDITVSKDMEASRGRCYDSVASQANADARMLLAVKADDRTMVTMVYLNNKQTVAIVSAATGHVVDKCAGTNLWDFMVAETEAKNKALGAGLGHAVTGLKWIAGAWAVTDVLSGYGTSYAVDGQFNRLDTTNEMQSRNTNTRNDDSGNTTTLSDSPSDSNTVDWNQANPVSY